MPQMDGFAVCSALKADPATAEAAIIFVTAHTDVRHETDALERGAVDFITKPINPAVVRARVRTHVTLKRQTDLLRRLATLDGLTGVGNRRMFDHVLGQEWSRARRAAAPLGLALLDIDFFKRFNDRYGHQAGDACLKSVAAALQQQVSRAGDFLARYGGEEFAVVLPDTDLAGAVQFAEKLCEGVRALGLPHAESGAGQVTISVGVASVVPDDGNTAEALIAAADQALYAAKAAGRNCVRPGTG
jgi:diguanylate cyclase (GGDEF)-like protein